MGDVPPRPAQRRTQLPFQWPHEMREQARKEQEDYDWLRLELGAPHNDVDDAILKVNGRQVTAEDFMAALANVHVAVTALAAADAITKVADSL